MFRFIVVFIILLIPIHAGADGFGFGADIIGLKGQVIVDAGEVREVEPPLNTEWQQKVYEINGRCFKMLGYFSYWGYGGKAGLLLIDKSEIPKIALLETGIGSVNVDVQHITLIHCPAGTIVYNPENPDEYIKAMKERKKLLEEQLKTLEQQ